MHFGCFSRLKVNYSSLKHSVRVRGMNRMCRAQGGKTLRGESSEEFGTSGLIFRVAAFGVESFHNRFLVGQSRGLFIVRSVVKMIEPRWRLSHRLLFVTRIYEVNADSAFSSRRRPFVAVVGNELNHPERLSAVSRQGRVWLIRSRSGTRA